MPVDGQPVGRVVLNTTDRGQLVTKVLISGVLSITWDAATERVLSIEIGDGTDPSVQDCITRLGDRIDSNAGPLLWQRTHSVLTALPSAPPTLGTHRLQIAESATEFTSLFNPIARQALRLEGLVRWLHLDVDEGLLDLERRTLWSRIGLTASSQVTSDRGLVGALAETAHFIINSDAWLTRPVTGSGRHVWQEYRRQLGSLLSDARDEFEAVLDESEDSSRTGAAPLLATLSDAATVLDAPLKGDPLEQSPRSLTSDGVGVRWVAGRTEPSRVGARVLDLAVPVWRGPASSQEGETSGDELDDRDMDEIVVAAFNRTSGRRTQTEELDAEIRSTGGDLLAIVPLRLDPSGSHFGGAVHRDIQGVTQVSDPQLVPEGGVEARATVEQVRELADRVATDARQWAAGHLSRPQPSLTELGWVFEDIAVEDMGVAVTWTGATVSVGDWDPTVAPVDVWGGVFASVGGADSVDLYDARAADWWSPRVLGDAVTEATVAAQADGAIATRIMDETARSSWSRERAAIPRSTDPRLASALRTLFELGHLDEQFPTKRVLTRVGSGEVVTVYREGLDETALEVARANALLASHEVVVNSADEADGILRALGSMLIQSVASSVTQTFLDAYPDVVEWAGRQSGENWVSAWHFLRESGSSSESVEDFLALRESEFGSDQVEHALDEEPVLVMRGGRAQQLPTIILDTRRIVGWASDLVPPVEWGEAPWWLRENAKPTASASSDSIVLTIADPRPPGRRTPLLMVVECRDRSSGALITAVAAQGDEGVHRAEMPITEIDLSSVDFHWTHFHPSRQLHPWQDHEFQTCATCTKWAILNG